MVCCGQLLPRWPAVAAAHVCLSTRLLSPAQPGALPLTQYSILTPRFEFNGFANPAYRPGSFELRIEGGIRAYRDPRPQLIMVSSGEYPATG